MLLRRRGGELHDFLLQPTTVNQVKWRTLMDKNNIGLIRALAFCGIVGFAAPTLADSPCPTVEYFLALYIHNGWDNWPFQRWIEFSELTQTEGEGATARCHYIGTAYESHPDVELLDPEYHWSADVATVLLQSSQGCLICE